MVRDQPNWRLFPKPKDAPESGPIFEWLRRAGIAGFSIGLAGLLVTDFYWPAVGFISAGLLLLAGDVLFDPALKKHRKFRYGVALCVAVGLGCFWKFYVLVPVPLEVIVFDGGRYQIGVSPESYPNNGAPWQSELTEIRLSIFNASDSPFSDVAVSIQPAAPVARAFITSDNPECHLRTTVQSTFGLSIYKPTGERASSIPTPMVASSFGYTVSCPSLQARSDVKITMGIGTVRKYLTENAPEDMSHVYEMKTAKGAFWYAYDANVDVYEAANAPKSVSVTASYKALGRSRKVALEAKPLMDQDELVKRIIKK